MEFIVPLITEPSGFLTRSHFLFLHDAGELKQSSNQTTTCIFSMYILILIHEILTAVTGLSIILIIHQLKPQSQRSEHLLPEIKSLNLMCVCLGSTVNPKSSDIQGGLFHRAMGLLPPTLQIFTSNPFFQPLHGPKTE